MQHHSPQHNNGITLIELMIAIAIVAILVAIGYPSYQAHVAQSRRAEAKSALMELSQFMEREYSQNGTYVLPTGTTLPIAQLPSTGTAYYQFSVSGTSSAGYTLTATPTGVMQQDSCGRFTLDQTGAKGANNLSSCW